ncbi:MAG: bifunctional riboflavin kinase/FAD synthetase [Gallionellaceae bacterium]|nr:MAG: bifunctional riboflavin kinase/FAD synthetase [Gallionellaceae bacterium]
MQILRGLSSPDKQPLALTVGNFDGVHLGHQALLEQLQLAARERGLATAAIVFEPHPREFFTPEQAPARLTNLREKLERFDVLGLNRVHVCRFNERMARTSAAGFINLLYRDLAVKHVLIGDDFRFGNARGGDFALMEKMGAQQGVTVKSMSSVLQDGVRISSTAVRMALAEGNLRLAQRYLGRPYSISGHVEHGEKVGRKLGYPTANIQLKHNRPALTGIFVVRVRIEGGEMCAGVASLGVRPTLEANGKPVLEVHLFDFDEQLYGKHLHVDFLHKLRDEMKFSGLESLTQQITLDVGQAKDWFKNGN